MATALIPVSIFGAGLERVSGVTWQALPGLLLLLLLGSTILRRQIFLSWRRIDRWSALMAAVVAIASSLTVWSLLQSQGTFSFVDMGLPAILLIAAANSFFEESLWRGAVLATLIQLRVAPGLAIVIQATSFGTAHIVRGYPDGVVGGLLAVAFGIALGILVARTRSIVLPCCVHMAVDVTIFATLFGR